MRQKILYLGMMLAATMLLASCNAVDNAMNTNTNADTSATASKGPETVYADGARRITTGELEALMKEGKAYVVDVRSQDSYDMGHIPGSRLIPAGLIEKHAAELPPDKVIVTYCS